MNDERHLNPLGIMPRYIWEEKRMQAIEDAIVRFNEANKDYPDAWLEELAELSKHTRSRRKKSHEV